MYRYVYAVNRTRRDRSNTRGLNGRLIQVLGLRSRLRTFFPDATGKSRKGIIVSVSLTKDLLGFM
jgi:hypothetical protein